jgi:hypothetical protein
MKNMMIAGQFSPRHGPPPPAPYAQAAAVTTKPAAIVAAAPAWISTVLRIT